MTRILKGRGVLKRDYLHALETSGEVIDAAERASHRLEREARERGYADGTSRAAAAIAEARLMRSRWLHQAHSDLAALAVEVGSALSGRASREDPSIVEELCRQAVERVEGATRIAVRTAPSDARGLEEAARALSLEIIADPSITPGGCVVESDLGSVDGRLETRTEALRAALEQVVRRYAGEDA